MRSTNYSSHSGCRVAGPHCENCGEPMSPFDCEDGYTPCCNELCVMGPDECRNDHGKD